MWRRFSRSTHVLAGLKVRFYMGAPLVASNGHRIGTLCAPLASPLNLHMHPREPFLFLWPFLWSHCSAMGMGHLDVAAARLTRDTFPK